MQKSKDDKKIGLMVSKASISLPQISSQIPKPNSTNILLNVCIHFLQTYEATLRVLIDLRFMVWVISVHLTPINTSLIFSFSIFPFTELNRHCNISFPLGRFTWEWVVINAYKILQFAFFYVIYLRMYRPNFYLCQKLNSNIHYSSDQWGWQIINTFITHIECLN